jgi:hypothetical protein
MGNPIGPQPSFDPHRRLPAEHAAVVAGKLGEITAYTIRLIHRLKAIGSSKGVGTLDLILRAHDALGVAQRHLKDPFAEPGRSRSTTGRSSR